MNNGNKTMSVRDEFTSLFAEATTEIKFWADKKIDFEFAHFNALFTPLEWNLPPALAREASAQVWTAAHARIDEVTREAADVIIYICYERFAEIMDMRK